MLAKLKNAELVTSDPESKQVERDVKLAWLATEQHGQKALSKERRE